MFGRTLLATTISAAMILPAWAHHDGGVTSLQGINVSHAHTVEVSATSHAIDVFLTIENTSDEPVTLTAAEVDFAQPGIFQTPVIGEDGKMSVGEVSSIEIAPGQTLTMQPGGVRVVFNDVKEAFEGGDHFEAHLQFEGMQELEIEVEVEHADGDAEPGHVHEHDEDMG